MSEKSTNKNTAFQAVLSIEDSGLFVGVQLKDKKGRVCATSCLRLDESPFGKATPFDMGLPRKARNRLYLFTPLTEEQVKALSFGDRKNRERENREQQTLLHLKRNWLQKTFGPSSFGEKDDEILNAEAKQLQHIENLEPYSALEGAQIYLCIYADSKGMNCVWGAREDCLKVVLHCVIVHKKFYLDHSGLHFHLRMSVYNPYGFQLGGVCLKVGELMGASVPVPEVVVPLTASSVNVKEYDTTLFVPMSELLSKENELSGAIQNAGNLCLAALLVDKFPEGFEDENHRAVVTYRLVKRIRPGSLFPGGPKHSKREAWVPVSALYQDGYALHLRRGFSGIFVLVKRPMEQIEYSSWFRFMESRFVSGLFFHLGRILNHIPHRRKVALFNEKYSEKAEEGVFELFQMCRESKKTRCYFILAKNTPDYQRLCKEKGVVVKYSLFYYWLLFNVNFYISSEAPSHLTLMNSNNPYLRWNLIRHPFVFLQHGVTYLKRHGERSTYLKGKAGQADYVIVNSDKERHIVSTMFDLDPNRIWNTGMLIFDQIEYGHINQSSEDKVTIMLTWKQDEELLQNYEDSSYFQYTMGIYEMLLKYVDRSQINVVAHPRAYELLKSTSLHDLVWDKPISEVLQESKLLITDYSSVCWNSFYQGGAVVFFQPDLEKYESFVGKLIPSNEEYIGPRVFDMESLEQVIADGIQNQVIQLDKLRTKENERMYSTINEHHDGNNTQRIYKQLKANGFV